MPIHELLPLSTLSKRYHSLVVRLYHDRLCNAANFTSRELLIDCFHPTARLTEPPLNCVCLGTDGLEELAACSRDAFDMQYYKDQSVVPDKKQGPMTQQPCPFVRQLVHLNGLYSRFRPYRRDAKQPRNKLPGDIPGSRTYSGAAPAPLVAAEPANNANPPAPTQSVSESGASSSNDRSLSIVADEMVVQELPPLVKQLIHFDGGEAFNQLVIKASIVVHGPRNGLYLSFVPVTEGWLRIFRRWLGERNEAEVADSISPDGLHAGMTFGIDGDVRVRRPERSTSQRRAPRDDPNILWVGLDHDIGIRFQVRERAWRHGATAASSTSGSVDEEMPVSYELAYEGISIPAWTSISR